MAKIGVPECLSSPVGGSKWYSPAGIQAQNPTKQGRHVFYFWESQGARYWLHPKLSEYIPIPLCPLYFLHKLVRCEFLL